MFSDITKVGVFAAKILGCSDSLDDGFGQNFSFGFCSKIMENSNSLRANAVLDLIANAIGNEADLVGDVEAHLFSYVRVWKKDYVMESEFHSLDELTRELVSLVLNVIVDGLIETSLVLESILAEYSCVVGMLINNDRLAVA